MNTLVSFTTCRNCLKDLIILASLLIGLLLTSCTGIGLSGGGGVSFLPNLGGSGLFSSNLSSYQASFTAGPNTKISVTAYKLPAALTVSVSYPVVSITNNHVNQISASAAYSKEFFGQSVTIGFIGQGITFQDININKGHRAFRTDTKTRIVNPARFKGTVTLLKTIVNGSTIVVPDDFADGLRVGESVIGIAAGGQLSNSHHFGVAVSADIMPIDIIGNNFLQTDGDNIPTAIKYAIDNRAKIINYGVPELKYVTTRINYKGNGYDLLTRDFATYYERLNRNPETSTLEFVQELKSRSSLVADAIGGKDVVLLVGTGNNYINGPMIDWNSENGKFHMRRLDASSSIVLDVSSFVNNATLESFRNSSITVIVNQAVSTFFGDGNKVDAANQPAGTFAALPFLDKRLGAQYVLVAGVDSNSKINGFGCGASKWWCISAPDALDSIVPSGTTTLGPIYLRDWNIYSSAVAAGALAVIQSRIPNLPVAAARAVMFKTADDLGATGVDAVYGHGLINLEKAMSVMGSISVAVPIVTVVSGVLTTLPAPTSKVVLQKNILASTFLNLVAPASMTAFTTPFQTHPNVKLIGAYEAYERGYFGQSVTIAFVGSGMNIKHVAFTNRIVNPIGIDGTSFVDRVYKDTRFGVGTFIAGLAAGAPGPGGDQDIHSGIATQAKIIPVDLTPSFISYYFGLLGDRYVGRDVGLNYAITSGAQIIHYEFLDRRGVNVKMVDSQGRKVSWKTSSQSELLSLIDNGSNGFLSNEAAAMVTMIGNRDLVMVGNPSNHSFNAKHRIHITVTIDSSSAANTAGEFESSVSTTSGIVLTITTDNGIQVITLNVNGANGATGASQTDSSSKVVYTADEFKNNVTITQVSGFGSTVSVNNIQVGSLFANGVNGVAGRFQNYPYLDSRLRSKFLLVGGVNISNNTTLIAPGSNGCGASKNWCLVARGNHETFATPDPLNDKAWRNFGMGSSASYDVAPVVAGALAVLKSRFPEMPMSVIRAILLKTADDLGEPGVDDIYGHGMINLGKAITLQGSVSLQLSNEPKTLTLVAPASATTYTLPTYMHGNITMIGAHKAYARGYFGQNVTIALVGSGMSTSHVAFANRIVKPIGVSGTSFVDQITDGGYGIGTHIAGLAAGAPGPGGIQDIQSGIAPQAKIMPVDMLPVTVTNHNFKDVPYPSIGNSTLSLNPIGDRDVAINYAITSGAQIIHYQYSDRKSVTVKMIDSQGRKVSWEASPQSEFLSLIDNSNNGFLSNEAAAMVTMIGNRDLIMVSNVGNNYFNANSQTISVDTNSYEYTADEFKNNVTITQVSGFGSTVSVNNIQVGSLFANGVNGVAGRFQNYPYLDSRLRSKFLLVGGLRIQGNTTLIAPGSNGCGASKNWCLVAADYYDYYKLPRFRTPHFLDNETWRYVKFDDIVSYNVAPQAAGALAVLKSRFPNMPMSVIRAILLKTATDLGEPGVDDIYGHGLINLGKAITLQGLASLKLGNVTITFTSNFVSLSAPASVTSYSLPATVNPNVTLMGAHKAYERGYFGQSVTIALIGDGMNTSHVAFTNRIVKPAAVSSNSLVTMTSYSTLGIGTHVAGMVAGATGQSGGTTDIHSGIAPQAKIIPIDISQSSDYIRARTIALDYAITSGAQIIYHQYHNATQSVIVQMVDNQGKEIGWNTVLTDGLISLFQDGHKEKYGLNYHYASPIASVISTNDVVVLADTGAQSFNAIQQTSITVTTTSNSTLTFNADDFMSLTITQLVDVHPIYPFQLPVSSTQLGSLFTDGLNGVSGSFRNYAYLDSRLQSKFLVVAAATVSNNTTVLVSQSNGCGVSKDWCLVAPVHSTYTPKHDDNAAWHNANYGSGVRYQAAPQVAGALAVLKSRLPDMPMSVIRAILLKTATDLGDPGVDGVYGHGMVNLAKAITLQGEVSLQVKTIRKVAPSITTMTSTLTVGPTETPPYLLKESNIVLSQAMSGLAQGVGGISMAVGVFDDYFYDTPFSSVLQGSTSSSNQLGFGSLAQEEMLAQTQSLGGFGIRRNSNGSLVDFGFKRKRIQLDYSFCTLGCSGSAWDEYNLDNESLPFFADTQRKFSSGWKVNNQLGAFVVLGLDDENSYDKYSQYGVNWSGINLGNWQLAGSFSSIQEQQGYVLGSKFNGAYSIGETTSTQLGLRAQRYINGWRVFGGMEYGKTKVDTLNYSSVRAIDGVQYAGWRFGLDKNSVLRGNDKIRFGLTKVPSVISGNMELLLSQTTGDTGFDEDLQTSYLNKTEFREHDIDLKGSSSYVYRLGYSTNIHKRQRLALGFEHYTDKISRDNTAISAQYRFEF